MKKLLCFVLLIVFSAGLFSCDFDDLDTVVSSEKYNYDMTEYVSLPNIENKEIEVKLDYVQSTIDSDIIDASTTVSNKTVVEEGDIVEVKYTGYYTDNSGNIKIDDDGKEVTFSGGSGTSKVYIGSHTFIEDFEKGLVGFEIGKEGQFKATFPSDYGVDDLNGKTVIFKATVNKIYTPVEYNLDYVKKTYGNQYNSIEEFENELKKSYALQQLLNHVLENAAIIDYPEFEKNLIANQIQEMELNFATQYGIEFDAYLKAYLGFNSREDYIHYTMKTEMAYYAYAQKFDIKVTKRDIANARKELISYYKEQYLAEDNTLTHADANERATTYVDQEFDQNELYQDALYSLVGEHMKGNCIIKEIPPTYTSVTKGGTLFN